MFTIWPLLDIFLSQFLQTTLFWYCQTSDLGLRLEVDFVFPLSQQQEQEQEEEEEQQPSPKFSHKGRY